MKIAGRCHCGNISFQLDWTPEPERIPARACDCGFCHRHGGVWTSCPTGSLEVAVRDPERVSAYEFETRTAQFHVCAVCGVAPVVSCRIDGQVYAVVNVNCFENVDASLLDRKGVSFDAEDAAARLARRKKGWIADVSFVQSP